MNGYAYYNDIDAYCCAVLKKNIERGYLPGGHIDERSITDVHASDFVGYNHIHLFAGIGGFPLGLQWAGIPSHLRILTGGFPCQDISNAGKRAGITGERSGLWKEQYRLICEAADCGMGFDYILIENVAALLHRGMGTVLSDLAAAGFDAEWTTLRASDVGAPHRRERIFIVAYAHRNRQRIGQSEHQRQPQRETTPNTRYDGAQGRMAHASSQGPQTPWTWQQSVASQQCSQAMANSTACRLEKQQSASRLHNQFDASDAWLAQSRICRVLNGLPTGMDRHLWPAGPGEEQHPWEPARTITERLPNRAKRLKALGNAIVPQLVALIGRAIVEHETDRGVA